MYDIVTSIRVITIGTTSCQVLTDGYRGLLNFYIETSVNCLIQIGWVMLIAGICLDVALTASQLLVLVFPKNITTVLFTYIPSLLFF